MNLEAANQATFLNTQGFIGVQAYYYWSSTSYAGGAGTAWVLFLLDGNMIAHNKSVSYYAWPVRAGQ